MKALKITTTDEVKLIDVENELEDLQREVGGHIEVVRLPSPGDIMIVDEEGKFKGKPANRIATLLIAKRDTIVGDVLCVTGEGEDFGDVDLTLATIANMIANAIKGVQLRRYRGNPHIRINDTPFCSKKKELAIRVHFHEGDEMDELQKMISVCEDELISGVPFHREDLFMYCVAMNNLIEIFLMQMTDNQKALYRKLSERCKVTAFVHGEESEPS